MIINRHNYEEFFLMYVDNELTPAQRAGVEAFVQQHQDLSDELKMLQQATIVPEEDIQFTTKDLLYRTEQGINLANCEEYFLLDVDNELSQSEKEEVEKFVLQHPQIQESFSLLHKTRLEPETVIFEDKAVLYRKVERRIVPIRWMRIAAAAVVIGIVGALYLTLPVKNDALVNSSEVAFVKPGVQPGHAQTPIVIKKVEEKVSKINEPIKPLANETNTRPVKEKVAVQKLLHSASTNNSIAANKAETKRSSNTNNLPTKDNHVELIANNTDNAANKEEDNSLAQNISRRIHSNTIAESKTQPITQASKLIDDNDHVMKQAVYRELDNNNEEEENSFLIGSAQINKNKLRGLLKKATSLFDKKGDKNEKEKSIQIASFEIKSK